MKGYLSQIGSAGGAGLSPAPMLRPFIRSRSPIAENDQRIGISGWEPPMSSGENEGSPSSDTEAPENISQPVARARPWQSATERHNTAPNVVSSPEPFEAPAKHPRMVAAPSRPASGEPKPFSADPQSRQFVSGSASEQKAHSEPETLDQENEQAGIRPKDRRSVAAFVESKTPASTSPPSGLSRPLGRRILPGPDPRHASKIRLQIPKNRPGKALSERPFSLARNRPPADRRAGTRPGDGRGSIARQDRENASRVPFDMPAAATPPGSRLPKWSSIDWKSKWFPAPGSGPDCQKT
jgi:hypothetical protein